jgi:hypothetical protein
MRQELKLTPWIQRFVLIGLLIITGVDFVGVAGAEESAGSQANQQTTEQPKAEILPNGMPAGLEFKPCLCVAPSAVLTWKAFKFTNKTGVPGTFKDITHFSSRTATTNETVLTSLGFRGSLLSVDTANPARDATLKEHFFSKLASTDLSGHIVSLLEDKAVLRLSLNKVTKDVPFTVKVSDKGEIVATGAIDMLEFGMKDAHESIHKACELLHTGEDKISKTWTDVEIEIKAQTTNDCDC